MAGLLVLLLAAGAAVGVAGLENGLAHRPPMGYNTWNAFKVDIDEELLMATADRMVSLGLKDAGYEFLNLDDGWSELAREGGRLVGNRAKFPSGIRALSTYVHGKGLKFGIYADSGALTCAGYPGSRGFEEVDARTWADWGVDMLKYDNCFAPAADWVVDRYTAMQAALNATGRHILYSLCEWGVADPWLWAPEVGNSWRTTEDIEPTWESILKIADYSQGLARFSGPGAWGDADMLEVGNGLLTLAEQRTHFALWCLFKSPLLIGADLRSIAPDSLQVLLAKEVIAVNQDPLGVSGDLIWVQGQTRIYAGPLAGGDRAVVLMNLHHTGGQYLVSNITVRWEQLGWGPDVRATVRDLYAQKDLGVFAGAFTAPVTAHDVAALRITPLRSPPGGDAWRPWHGQPIYAASQGGDEPPRREDLVPHCGREPAEDAARYAADGADCVAVGEAAAAALAASAAAAAAAGGQHPLFADA